MLEEVIFLNRALTSAARSLGNYFSLFFLTLQVLLQGFLVDPEQRLGAVRLQVHVSAFRPATGLTGLSKRDALAYEASRAIQQLSGLCNCEQLLGFHARRVLDDLNVKRLAGKTGCASSKLKKIFFYFCFRIRSLECI
jgi:hypothetical protein